MKKTVVTITGIRPDFIRMSEIFKKLDQNFNHILVHSGQHFEKMLSDVFFEELDIREPDYNLGIGGPGKEHFHQIGDAAIKIIELFRIKNIKPDIILFLGDSNSALLAPILKKEGYVIGHIESGMRSGDKRMLEEINRICCDHSSDYLFTYHENYKQKALKENIPEKDIFVVGNTIVEVSRKITPEIMSVPPTKDYILMDIHRPENFKHMDRMQNIIRYAETCKERYNIPVKMLKFGRTVKMIEEYHLDMRNIDLIDLVSFKTYQKLQYNSSFMISDSGTAQEEPALLNTPVIVPRDFTERPESVENNCSFMIKLDGSNWNDSFIWLNKIQNGSISMNVEWLGNGTTSHQIIKILKEKL